MAMLDRNSLELMGFASLGENVFISEKASFYNPGNISIASNVRIDDFCVLSAGSGGIEIGNFVHISVACSLIGKGKISLSDFSSLSARVAVYSSNEDFSGASLTNPTVPEEYTRVTHADVVIERHAIVGSGSVVLPGVVIREGAAIGALSLVKEDCEEFGIYLGTPATRRGNRKRDILDLEKKLLSNFFREDK